MYGIYTHSYMGILAILIAWEELTWTNGSRQLVDAHVLLVLRQEK